ncbi:MAG: triose-phosphate isomerase [Patescibacteria group bacterium]|jgi:triosephosphate isomerase
MIKPLLIANWKMNKTLVETVAFINIFKKQAIPNDRAVVICPPFTLLASFKDQGLKYGAQTMHWEDKGAYTGEISPSMLKEFGCSYVIIGHSERRQYNNETDETVLKKIQAAWQYNLIPVVCISELKQVPVLSDYKDLVIAYEPLWAIGTGKTATPEHAQQIHSEIRKIVGANTRIIYGGSVNSSNAGALMSQPDVNGLLVGGASLDAGEFGKIINY